MFTYQGFQHIQRFCPFLVEAQQQDPNLTGGHVLKEKLIHGMTNNWIDKYFIQVIAPSRCQQIARLMWLSCSSELPWYKSYKKAMQGNFLLPFKVHFWSLFIWVPLPHFTLPVLILLPPVIFCLGLIASIYVLLILPSLCVQVCFLVCQLQVTVCMFPSIPAFFLVFGLSPPFWI